MRSQVARSALFALATLVAGFPVSGQEAGERPQLLVLIAVDQMRADLLDRYADVYTGGFRRLLDQGYRFTEASHAHAHTETAAGHATLTTGSFPSRSGIVANDWVERSGEQWSSMYAVEDTLSPIVGVTGLEGRSPRNLLRGGLPDWIMAADRDARVVSLSQKDRSAITMAGQTRGEVYWIATPLARFVTSSYYRSDYPRWVARFNEEVMPKLVADSVWLQTAPEEVRRRARADSALYEYDGIHTTFPHKAWEEADSGAYNRNTWALEAQPRADRAVRLLAEVAVKELDLGQRGNLDYLGLSFSSTDYVGHAFGPFSQEQLENLLSLDRQLGELFEVLDREVGVGRWVAGLSADHGVMTSPEYLVESGEDPNARRIAPAALTQQLRAALQEAASGDGGEDAFAERLARTLEEKGTVARAYTHRALTGGEPADSFAVLFRNSYYPGRAAGQLSRFGVEFRLGYHQLLRGRFGSSHGTPYWYDRTVPFLLLGAGVSPGTSRDPVYTVDMAPTLAGLAGISMPDDLDGRRVYR